MNLSDITSIENGRTIITIKNFRCIVPTGLKVVGMPKYVEDIVGNLTPGVTYNQTIYLNNDTLPLIDYKVLVHECVHGFQERKMGKLSYKLTYLYQSFLLFFKVGFKNIHANHIMENEARTIADLVVNNIYIPSQDTLIDIEKEIRKYYVS